MKQNNNKQFTCGVISPGEAGHTRMLSSCVCVPVVCRSDKKLTKNNQP